MTFEDANSLCDEIIEFLFSCGDTYTQLNGELEFNILSALGSGQYVMKRGEDGKILYFVSYWRVHPEDIEAVTQRMRPADIFHGSVMYVTECGNKAGRAGMVEIVKTLREKGKHMKGVFWHRIGKGKEESLKFFPSQEGIYGDH